MQFDNIKVRVIDTDEHDISKTDFDKAVQKYYDEQKGHPKFRYWTKALIAETIRYVEEYRAAPITGAKRTAIHYSRGNVYDVLEVGCMKSLIFKRKNVDSPTVVIPPVDDYYNIITDCHRDTGHGGRDKMIYALKDHFSIPRWALEIFLKHCQICQQKKSLQKSGIVKPIFTKDFFTRGQVDLIDFQSVPDGEYKWLLNYQDHATKFIFLRPLKAKNTNEVARKLLHIFLQFGCPSILQSDNGREFTALVIKDLHTMWPDCKIINGLSPHPASQGSIEPNNQDIENMLRTWMADHKSKQWSVGCHFVQWQKNTSFHGEMKRSPYCAMFGNNPEVGFKNSHIPHNLFDQIENEEDLDQILHSDYSSSRSFLRTENIPKSNSPSVTDLSSPNSMLPQPFVHDEKADDSIPGPSQPSFVDVNDLYNICSKCDRNITNEIFFIKNYQTICDHCNRRDSIMTKQSQEYNGQKQSAEYMIKHSAKKFKNDFYQIGTKIGILKD